MNKKILTGALALLMLAGCSTKTKTCDLLELSINDLSVSAELGETTYTYDFEEETNVLKALKNSKNNCYNYELTEDGTLSIKLDGVSGDAKLELSPVVSEDIAEEEVIEAEEETLAASDYFSDKYIIKLTYTVPNSHTVERNFYFLEDGKFNDEWDAGHITYVSEDDETVTLDFVFGQTVGEGIKFAKSGLPILENKEAETKHMGAGPNDYTMHVDEVLIEFVEK